MNREAADRSIIVVGVDFTERSERALSAARELARVAVGPELHLVHVRRPGADGWAPVSGLPLTSVPITPSIALPVPFMPVPVATVTETERRQTEEESLPDLAPAEFHELKRLAQRLAGACEARPFGAAPAGADHDGATGETPRIFCHLREGDAAREMARLAAELDADLIVVGTHGRTGIERLLLGSVAEEVMRHGPCPVLVIKPKSHLEPKRVTKPISRFSGAKRGGGGQAAWDFAVVSKPR
jgi:nucleotide-binding universal stress UspA family protein